MCPGNMRATRPLCLPPTTAPKCIGGCPSLKGVDAHPAVKIESDKFESFPSMRLVVDLTVQGLNFARLQQCLMHETQKLALT